MYNRRLWQDSVRDPARTYTVVQNSDGTMTLTPAGKEVQKGTNQSATNFNGMEDGIQDANIATGIILQHLLQTEPGYDEKIAGLETECGVETGSVTLTNSMKYPFNNSIKTVALATARKTANYLVECAVSSYSGGLPGEIKVSEKALNGFKLEYDGSASSVTLKYIVKGGVLS
jgi:hypothetical protein